MDNSNNKKPSNCKCIPGVLCDVKNCVYHDGERNCEATQINVGPNYAITSADTICSTFKSK